MKPSIVSFGIAVLRLALAAVFFAHAGLKLLVLGLSGTSGYFTAHNIPGWLAYPVFGSEAAGAILLTLGIAVRTTSVILAGVVLGAIYVHAPYGWSFTAPGGGWEYPAFLLVTLIVQAMLGPGSLQSILKNNDAGKGQSTRRELTVCGLVVLLVVGSLAGPSRLQAGEEAEMQRQLGP